MSVLNNTEIRNLLQGLIQTLQRSERGILPANLSQDQKNQMIDTLIQAMENSGSSIQSGDLTQNPALLKKLTLGLIAAFQQQQTPGMTFDFGLLFKPDRNLTQEDRETLSRDMKNLLRLIINPNNQKQNEAFEKALDEIANAMVENMLLQPRLERDADAIRQNNQKKIHHYSIVIVSGLGDVQGVISDPQALGSPGQRKVVLTISQILEDGLSDTELGILRDLDVPMSGFTPKPEV